MLNEVAGHLPGAPLEGLEPNQDPATNAGSTPYPRRARIDPRVNRLPGVFGAGKFPGLTGAGQILPGFPGAGQTVSGNCPTLPGPGIFPALQGPGTFQA